jgi:hypothetical protein
LSQGVVLLTYAVEDDRVLGVSQLGGRHPGNVAVKIVVRFENYFELRIPVISIRVAE